MGPMVIEGSKTGEERLVSLVERRESKPPKAGAPLETGIDRDKMLAKEQSRNRKLEQELKKLQELLRQKTLECAEANDRLVASDGVISQLQSQIAASAREHSKLMAMKDAELHAMRDNLDRQMKEMQSHMKDHERRRLEEISVNAKGMEAREAAERQLSKRTQELEVTNSTLIGEVLASKTRAEAIQKQLDSARDEVANVEQRSKADLREARNREMKLLADVAAARQMIEEREGKFVEWQGKVDSVNKYIVQICQPQFTVVKDETMAPMPPPSERNPNDPNEGFVLVPLQLMLEGYGLLPTDSKKKINDDYESSKTEVKRSATMPYKSLNPRGVHQRTSL